MFTKTVRAVRIIILLLYNTLSHIKLIIMLSSVYDYCYNNYTIHVCKQPIITGSDDGPFPSMFVAMMVMLMST